MNKVIFIFLFAAAISYSQWQSDLRLTNNPALSGKGYNNASSIANNGSFVHVVWHDRRGGGNPKLFYKNSTDAGSTWGSDQNMIIHNSSSVYPSVSSSGTAVHIIWQDHRSGGGKTFYKRSPDNGSTWSADVQLSNGTSSFSEYPAHSLSGSELHVVWEDNRDGNIEIYYRGSSNSGLNWGTETRLTNNPSSSFLPSVSVSGQIVHVVWIDERDGNKEVYYKRSADGGQSWGADTRLTVNVSLSNFPSVSVSGSLVVAVWQDVRDGGWEIYCKRSADNGISWGADTRLTNEISNSFYPSVFVFGMGVHVAWSDVRDANWETYYKRSIDGGTTWSADTRLTNDIADSFYPSISVSDSLVNVVWVDSRDGNEEIYFKRNPAGNPLGIQSISLEIPEFYSISQNYPNPFNPVTNIEFSLTKASFVKLVVHDITGREIETLVSQNMNAGVYKADWNGSNHSSGVYFYTIEAGEFTDVKKMILVK